MNRPLNNRAQNEGQTYGESAFLTAFYQINFRLGRTLWHHLIYQKNPTDLAEVQIFIQNPERVRRVEK